jgi:protein-S-isoprenylcysteine O-methyltransferase Ste14
MEEPILFQIIFFSLWALLAIIRGYYYLKNSEEKEKTPLRERLNDLKAEGRNALILTAIFIPFFVVALISYILAPPWMAWTKLPIPPILQWLGVAIALGSNALFIWVHRTLDRQWSLSLRIKTEHQLITSGPYKYVRHPMYTAFGIYTLGMILISADILLLIAFTVSLAYNIHRVDREELMLIEEFGDAYRNYMKHTSRFLPHLRSPVNTSTTRPQKDATPS